MVFKRGDWMRNVEKNQGQGSREFREKMRAQGRMYSDGELIHLNDFFNSIIYGGCGDSNFSQFIYDEWANQLVKSGFASDLNIDSGSLETEGDKRIYVVEGRLLEMSAGQSEIYGEKNQDVSKIERIETNLFMYSNYSNIIDSAIDNLMDYVKQNETGLLLRNSKSLVDKIEEGL